MPPIYREIAGAAKWWFMAVHPMSAPKLKVRPKKSCGHHVMRFMRGYVMMSGRVRHPRIMVVLLNCRRMVDPISNKVARKSVACFTLIWPLAIGRFLVRSTRLSRSRSHISLMTQPAPRMIIAPKENKQIIYKVCNDTFCIAFVDNAIPHREGRSKSHIPIGRSKRKRYRYGCAAVGKVRSNDDNLLMSVCSLVLSVFVMTDYIYKYPRLFLNGRFEKNGLVSFDQDQLHYLRNVLRQQSGDRVRIFNGSDGEWLAEIVDLGKKRGELKLVSLLKPQKNAVRPLHLYFSPIKKQRMDILIEKAVELGVTDLHPVLMHRTENRKLNMQRITSHIIEASEQCERMDLPVLHQAIKFTALFQSLKELPLYAAMEREDGAKALNAYKYTQACGFIIGPEGGFDKAERAMLLDAQQVSPVCLGDNILRAETAVIACLSYAQLSSY